MSKFMDDAKRLDQLAEDYKVTGMAIKCANAELVEIMVGISTRLQQEQRRNEDHAKELRATIADTVNRSAIVRKMAQGELERLEAENPEITPEERQMFIDKLNETNAALADMRKIEKQLTTIRAELKRQIDADFKLSKLSPVDALILSRNIEDKKRNLQNALGRNDMKKAYYQLRPYCGSALDTGERCDCESGSRSRAEGRQATFRGDNGKILHMRREDTFTALLRNSGGYAQ